MRKIVVLVFGFIFLSASAYAANDSFTQQALAKDALFRDRVKGQLIAEAFIVLDESSPDPARLVYARQILNGLDREVDRILPIIVMRTNLMAFATSYDFTSGHMVTTAGDADILSQIATDFDAFAGV